jgi:hypothetical protein
MAFYVNIETLQFGISETEIRLLYPQTSFPTPFAPPEQYRVVFAAPEPEYDNITQIIKEIAPILTNLGTWQQQWEVVPKFIEHTDDNGIIHTIADQLAAQAEMARTASVPHLVSMRQARLALLQNNLLDAVNAAVGQMPQAAQIEWEYATEVKRENELVLTMKNLLTWTDLQMDGLFILAKGL